MSKHTYGFPAGIDKQRAINTALAQAQADGYITGPDAASTEVVESDAHSSDADELVLRNGEEHVMPHAPEFVVIVRTNTASIG